MTVQARLIARLRAAGVDLPEGVQLRRSSASASQRVQGAWSWCAVDAAGLLLYEQGGTVGSQWNMGQLLAAGRWEVNGPDRDHDVHIDMPRR